jgi:S-adenosylmethionine uptake transporter
VVVASAWLYQEKVSPVRWLLLAAGLACVIVIVRPERSDQALGWQALLPVGLLVSGSGYLLLGSRWRGWTRRTPRSCIPPGCPCC